ncbi:MAG: ABC transporter permease [Candidatus Nanohaloarchaea archaeon]
MNLKKYPEFVKMGFRTFFAYRLDAVSSLLNSVIFLVLMYAVWSSIAASGSLTGGVDKVISYIMLGQVISSSVFMNAEKLLSGKIQQGTIVNELKRPISLRSQTYFHLLGIAVFNTVFVGVPLLLTGIIFLGVDFPGMIRFLWFVLSVFLSFNMVFMLSYSVSMLIFWTKIGWSLRMMRNNVQRLFSGVYFPLYLLPPPLAGIFSLLPFQAMVDGPITIFMNPSAPVTGTLLKQVFWIIILFIVSELLWRKARKKLTVQGG